MVMNTDDEIYTSAEDAINELKNRWNDKELEDKVKDYLGNDIPSILNDCPHLVIFRNIVISDNESGRLVNLAKDFNIKVAGLEFTADKFVAFNFDKYTMAIMFIKDGKQGNGLERIYKKKLIDLRSSEGKKFSEINTLWGESLVDFHHNILYEKYPGFIENIIDLSSWLKRNGGNAKKYYDKFVTLLIRNCILCENFEFEGSEGEFTKNVFIPAFKKNKDLFGLKPLIVKIAPEDYKNNNSWWYHDSDVKIIVKDYIDKKKK